jgi:hypothetical protein
MSPGDRTRMPVDLDVRAERRRCLQRVAHRHGIQLDDDDHARVSPRPHRRRPRIRPPERSTKHD